MGRVLKLVACAFAAPAALAAGSVLAGCRDVSDYTTTRSGDRFEGQVIQGDFVRAGVDATTTLCMSFDADHVQDSPGTISTSDGRFRSAPLRAIPQLWHDPLSMLSFGEGRIKNLIYVATASTPYPDGRDDDLLVVLSLMQGGGVEVRLIRGAPGAPSDSGASGVPGAPATPVFAVFALSRRAGTCSY